MIELRDQLNRTVKLSSPARRIVSLVPSQTELLVYLGVEEQLLGITAWCVQPPHLLKSKTVIGGTKDINIEKVKSLQPDLIVANKEENPAAVVEALETDFPVYVSDVRSIKSAYGMITDLGKLTAKLDIAKALVRQLKEGFEALPPLNKPLTYLYFIWNEPKMVAGPDTFVSNLLSKAGFVNLAPESAVRYPQLNEAQIRQLNPDIILLTSEPYCFTSGELHAYAGEYQPAYCSIINGENITWYGNRMTYALNTIRCMINRTKYII